MLADPADLNSIIGKFPRVQLTHKPTPLVRLPRFAQNIATPKTAATNSSAEIYIKRDDLTGLAFGGNKTRQVEFYIGAALKNNCDMVICLSLIHI